MSYVLSHSVVSNSLQPHGLQPTRLLCPWVFLRQEYWSGLPFPFPRDLLNPGIEPRFPALQADSLPSEPPEKRRDTTALLVARWVAGENRTRTLVRNVGPRPGEASEPGCVVRSKLGKKKQGIYRWCPWGIRAYFFKRGFLKNDYKVIYHLKKKKKNYTMASSPSDNHCWILMGILLFLSVCVPASVSIFF